MREIGKATLLNGVLSSLLLLVVSVAPWVSGDACSGWTILAIQTGALGVAVAWGAIDLLRT